VPSKILKKSLTKCHHYDINIIHKKKEETRREIKNRIEERRRV
jgi:hypothetical protein